MTYNGVNPQENYQKKYESNKYVRGWNTACSIAMGTGIAGLAIGTVIAGGARIVSERPSDTFVKVVPYMVVSSLALLGAGIVGKIISPAFFTKNQQTLEDKIKSSQNK